MGIKLALLFSTVRLFQDHCDGEVLEQSTGTECVVLIEVSFCLPYKNYDQLFLFSLFPRCKKKPKTVTYFRPDAVLDEKTSFNGSKTHFHQTSVRDAFDFALYCIKSLDWVGGRCCSKESKIPVSQTTFEGLHMPL